jgi:hypothetical protein
MELSAQYIAGLFDGEGSISYHIGSAIDDRTHRSYNTHFVYVRLSNNNRQVLELIRNAFGGVITSRMDRYRVHRNYTLQIRMKKAKTFLEAILPYLVVKRNLAWIMWCFLANSKIHAGHAIKGRQGFQQLDEKTWELRRALHLIVVKINGRGKPHDHSAAAFFVPK